MSSLLSSTAPIWVITNPAAGRGRGSSRSASVRAAFAGAHFIATSEPGHEQRLAATAIANGASTIVAVGGDGTCSQIASAILETRSQTRLAVVPCGTGNDFAKTLGVLRHSPAEIAHLIDQGLSTQIDVGWADGHYFLNSCGFGFDAAVLEASKRISVLRGDAVYIYSALRQLFGYEGLDVSSGPEVDSHGRMLMVTASNGRSLGGAFTIAPHASVVDGKLDFCFVADATVIDRVRIFVAAMRGAHLRMPAVSALAVAQFTLTFAAAPAMELDGELLTARGRTVDLRCIPRALSVISAPGAIA